MVDLGIEVDAPILACDSYKHYKSWYDGGEKKEFRGLLAVVVSPLDPPAFDDYYDAVMKELCDDFDIPRRRLVYKSADIGRLLDNKAQYQTFCLNFARAMWDFEDAKYTYVVTRINTEHLIEPGKVRIYGEYGSPTQDIPVPEFLDMIEPHYNVLANWLVTEITGLSETYCLLDGVDQIQLSEAWQDLRDDHHPRIVYNGDRIVPALSTADILLRSMEFFLQQKKEILDEHLIKEIVTMGTDLDLDNLYFEYMGNPHLQQMKPLRERPLYLGDIEPYIKRPIIFVSAGGVTGQRPIAEDSPVFTNILRTAAGLDASVRFYDPNRDRQLVGRRDTEDYFVALNDTARQQYQALRTAGWNVELLDPTGGG